jgi:hypothetical protein
VARQGTGPRGRQNRFYRLQRAPWRDRELRPPPGLSVPGHQLVKGRILLSVTDAELQAAEARFRKLDALREEARTARNEAIRGAVAEGRSQVEVARLLGVTKARINSIVASG